jgi:hypothetical protein
LVPLIPNTGFEDKHAAIRALHAQGLRMAGEDRRSKSVILEIMDFPFSTWRLTGAENKERNYLKNLAARIDNSIAQQRSNLSREAEYYLVRATAQHLLQDVKMLPKEPK